MGPNDNTPNNKVIGGGVAGAIVAIIAWGARQFAHIEIPPEVAIALSTIIGTIVAYFIPSNQPQTDF